MKKKISISLIVFVLLGVAGVILYFIFGQNSSIKQDGSLSERSREYLESRKGSNDDAEWRNVNFEKKRASDEELADQFITIDDCFGLKVPFGVEKEQERNTCTYAFSLQPTGWLVVSYEDSAVEDVESVPGVMVRRQKTDEYKEYSVTNTEIPFTVFRRIASEYESSAVAIINGKLLTISLSVPSNEDFDAKFEVILKGVELF